MSVSAGVGKIEISEKRIITSGKRGKGALSFITDKRAPESRL